MNQYFLGRDDDGHWYLVKEGFRSKWRAWVDSEPDDDPEFATRIDNPYSLTFWLEQ